MDCFDEVWSRDELGCVLTHGLGRIGRWSAPVSGVIDVFSDDEESSRDEVVPVALPIALVVNGREDVLRYAPRSREFS